MHYKSRRLNNKLSHSMYVNFINILDNQKWLLNKEDHIVELIDTCADEAELSLISDVIKRFTYIDSSTLEASLKSIANQIANVWSCTPQNSIIVGMDKSRHADSSSAIAWFLKASLAEYENWETIHFYKGLGSAVDDVPDNGNIVIVDEFVGSGTTLKKTLKWVRNKLLQENKQANIYVSVIAAMEHTKTASTIQVDNYYASIWLKKAIDDYYDAAEASIKRKIMVNIEANLSDKDQDRNLSKYSLGFKKSQSTYYLQNGNPPNNNFPIFWWRYSKNGAKRKTLFTRV